MADEDSIKSTRNQKMDSNKKSVASDESLTFSVTPPILQEDNKPSNENSDDSISEHLTLNSGGTENDRSFQEIEISYQPSMLLNLSTSNETLGKNTPEKPISIEPSLDHYSDEEDQSLKDIESNVVDSEGPNKVPSILEEIPPSMLLNLSTSNETLGKNTLEKPISIEPSIDHYSDEEDQSLKDIESNVVDSEGPNRARSILEEILCNDQFQSDQNTSLDNSKEESFNIFGNVNFDDQALENLKHNISVDEKNLYASDFQFPVVKNENETEKRMRDFEELIAVKDSTIAALTSELDSVREGSHTNTGSTLSTTEYKQLQEECHNKILEYSNEIIYKNDLIQQLSESLNQSVMERKDLLEQIDHFKEEIMQLQEQLQETTKMVEDHKCLPVDPVNVSDGVKIMELTPDIELLGSGDYLHPQSNFLTFENTLSNQQKTVFDLIKKRFEHLEQSGKDSENKYREEIQNIKEKARQEKEEYDTEISRLRDLLANLKCGSAEIMDLKDELEAKHSREMEELRTYFEKKCAELEKNYSEEVFSQQSRKLSGSTCSDLELNSDMYSHQPAPDSEIRCDIQPNITKKDIVNLQNEMQCLLDKISNYSLENITEEEFGNLKNEIAKSNLNNLLKFDLSLIRNDLQNKYHAELEVMREDNENKFDELRIKYENNVQNLDTKYREEIDNLKIQLEDMQKQNMSLCSAVQEVGSSGDFEISEVIQSYERRLQEQVTLAKIDFISALENQIQRLVANENDDEDWPSELLQLRDRFTEKYEEEIQNMKKQHEEEMEKMKEENLRVLNNALDRARRRSLRDNDKTEIEILRERDILKRQVSSQRYLLGELLKYYTKCEDELNNTLVDELLKQSFDKNVSATEESDLNNSSLSSSGKTSVTRIHLTPNFNEIINLIEINCKDECESKDISIDLQNELGVCLAKLKQEANAILAATTTFNKQNHVLKIDEKKSSSIDEKINSLTRQIITEGQAKERLKEELEELKNYVSSLEKEKGELEAQLEQIVAKDNILEAELAEAKTKISELIENGHKEIVSEGYGDGSGSHKRGESMTLLRELQDKARSILAQSRASADPTLLHLIEELCRVGERIKEESTREKQDLLQQIEVADKKYKTTQKFLDDQANEREQERDEAQKKIDMLYGQLRECDKDKANCERMTSEIEHLEHQLLQMTKSLDEESQRCKDIESERNEAVEKIKLLRDIIRDLENKCESKSEEVNHLVEKIQKLECIIEEQECSVNDVRQKESSKDVSDLNELYRHIEQLEAELQQLRVNSELAGSEGATLQIKKQLFELEQQIDKKTKDLETLHSSGNTNCSSPSEDISARDIARLNVTTMDECEVPLQQLARLKEKLIRHSRAEDAAVKRIKDLEMQIFGLKTEIEEACNEKECMKKQLQEQLVLISDLQIRLDEQRIRAEHIEKQTNTSLEMKIYDMTNEITMLRDKLHNKEKLYSQQQSLLAETQDRLRSLENEIKSEKDDVIIVSMQKELEILRKENAEMKEKIEKEAQIVPNLVENIISDKNSDIEKLRQKLEDNEKLLETYSQLNLTPRELQTLLNLKNNGSCLTEVFSILDLSQADQMRRADSANSEHLSTPLLRIPNKHQEEGTLLEPELSAISPALMHSMPHPRNSTTVSQKKVHFEDTALDNLKSEVAALEEKLEAKDEIIKTYEERLQLLNSVEGKIEKLQLALDETEKTLANATERFEREQQELRDNAKELGIELAEKKLKIEEQEKKIDMLEQDSCRKDEMCLNLAKEKRDLEDELLAIKKENFETIDNIIKVKNKEIEEIQEKLSHKNRFDRSTKEDIKSKECEINSLQKEVEGWSYQYDSLQEANTILEEKLKESNKQIDDLKKELQNQYDSLQEANKILDEKLKESNKQIEDLKKELQNKLVQIESITTEHTNIRDKLNRRRRHLRDHEDTIDRQKRTIANLEKEVKNLKDVVTDRECEIEIANEDAKRYQNDIAALELEIKTLKKSDIDKLNQQIKEKDMKINELAKEKSHMEELVSEKEKIITQMAEDSRQLHVNLMTIKNKIKEPGNILDLGNKLKEEQKRNAELMQEIHDLKAQLLKYRNSAMIASVEDITDQLKKELDNSAQLDSNILNAVSDHSLSSLSESRDVDTYKKMLAREKVSKKQLISQVNILQAKNSELLIALEREKSILLQVQTEDAKLIEQLRIQLDTVLDSEGNLRQVLEEKAGHIRELEDELDSFRRKNTVTSFSKTDSTEYKKLPSWSSRELNRLQKDFDILRTEKNALLNDYILLKQELFDTEKALASEKQKVELSAVREKQLEEELENMMKKEMNFKENLVHTKLRIEHLTDELERERANFARQKQELLDQLKLQSQKHAESVRSTPLPDEVLNKIRDLNSALLDNRKLMDIIQKIQNEKKELEIELEQLKSKEPQETNYSELASWSQHLFAKSLRLDSNRKALAWQKRYLISYIQAHEKHCLVQESSDNQCYKKNFSFHFQPKQHFRAAVHAIISIHRMKYLVKRWHSGVRIAEKINMRHYKNMNIKSEPKIHTNFHLGQPVSSQLFSNIPTTPQRVRSTNPFLANQERPSTSREEMIPWSGQTPPSKENANEVIRIGSCIFKKEDMTPLKAPQLLDQFVERFDQLQEKMGLVLESNNQS